MGKSSGLEKELLIDNCSVWENADDKEREGIKQYCEGYKSFLNSCKTERECTGYILSSHPVARSIIITGTNRWCLR